MTYYHKPKECEDSGYISCLYMPALDVLRDKTVIAKERVIFMAEPLFVTHDFRNCSEIGGVRSLRHPREMLLEDKAILRA